MAKESVPRTQILVDKYEIIHLIAHIRIYHVNKNTDLFCVHVSKSTNKVQIFVP